MVTTRRPLERSTTSAPVGVDRAFLFGAFTHKERWGLSAMGWLLVFVLVSFVIVIFVRGIYPFLAITDRVDSDVLVVEGWISKYAISVAAEEFTRGHYQRVFTTGGPVTGSGGYRNDYNTSASVGAGNLKAAGVPSERVQMTPSRVMSRDRTYGSAMALREWFQANNFRPPRINVATEALHARRTRLLFQKALGSETKVGVIAITSPDYDPKHWWKYSEAVREIEGETLGYFYARLFFHPASDK